MSSFSLAKVYRYLFEGPCCSCPEEASDGLSCFDKLTFVFPSKLKGVLQIIVESVVDGGISIVTFPRRTDFPISSKHERTKLSLENETYFFFNKHFSEVPITYQRVSRNQIPLVESPSSAQILFKENHMSAGQSKSIGSGPLEQERPHKSQ